MRSWWERTQRDQGRVRILGLGRFGVIDSPKEVLVRDVRDKSETTPD